MVDLVEKWRSLVCCQPGPEQLTPAANVATLQLHLHPFGLLHDSFVKQGDYPEMNWDEFKDAAPELAGLGEGLFERTGVVLVGTIRKDGSPRISPVEPLIYEGQLYLGMMWQSLKALDLLRDPRCTVHSAVIDREGAEGEFKLYGRAVDIQDPDERRRYGEALYQKIGFRPEEPDYHLFSVDIFSAAFFITQGDYRVFKRWRAGEPAREFRQGGDGKLAPV